MNEKNISIVTLGCSKNEIDSELMMGILKKNNYKMAKYFRRVRYYNCKYLWIYKDCKRRIYRNHLGNDKV